MRLTPVIVGVALVVSLATRPAAAQSARDAMAKGIAAHEAEDFNAAIEAFNEASQQAEEQNLDRAHALYNMGNAFSRSDEHAQAADIYLQALRSSDLKLQTDAYFNRGNAMAALAGEQRAAGQFEEALKYIDEASMMYENAMMLAPGDEDPKVNYELLTKMQEEVKKEQEQQQQQQQSENKNEGDGEDGEGEEQADAEGQPGDTDDMSESDQEQGAESGDSEQRDQGPQQLLSSEEAMTEKMTEQEALILLDALREEEKANRTRMRVILGQQVPVDKDW